MRHKENEITDRIMLDQIISGALYCHLACSINDQPYLIPLSFGYDGEYVYFHTALNGKKSDIFLQNSNVCLGFEREVSLEKDEDQACDWSFHFQSVIATGVIQEVTKYENRLSVLDQIMAHYSDKKWTFPEKTLARTRAWKVYLKSITGKQSLD